MHKKQKPLSDPEKSILDEVGKFENKEGKAPKLVVVKKDSKSTGNEELDIRVGSGPLELPKGETNRVLSKSLEILEMPEKFENLVSKEASNDEPKSKSGKAEPGNVQDGVWEKDLVGSSVHDTRKSVAKKVDDGEDMEISADPSDTPKGGVSPLEMLFSTSNYKENMDSFLKMQDHASMSVDALLARSESTYDYKLLAHMYVCSILIFCGCDYPLSAMVYIAASPRFLPEHMNCHYYSFPYHVISKFNFGTIYGKGIIGLVCVLMNLFLNFIAAAQVTRSLSHLRIANTLKNLKFLKNKPFYNYLEYADYGIFVLMLAIGSLNRNFVIHIASTIFTSLLLPKLVYCWMPDLSAIRDFLETPKHLAVIMIVYSFIAAIDRAGKEDKLILTIFKFPLYLTELLLEFPASLTAKFVTFKIW